MKKLLLLVIVLFSGSTCASMTSCGEIDHPLINADLQAAQEIGISYEFLEDDAYPGCKVIEVTTATKMGEYEFASFTVQMKKDSVITGEFYPSAIRGEDHLRTVFLLCESAAKVADTVIHFGDNCHGKSIALSIAIE
ncbi:hypothetical protein ACNKU7_18495 [Microbulbifer sp. SA54]|uniref:hypothetical protein n=1 Tax=Microbulbifer sp. SA54 TaxID=3401577 RepID=UPI003AAEB440